MGKEKLLISIMLPVEIYDMLTTLAEEDYKSRTAYILSLIRGAWAKKEVTP